MLGSFAPPNIILTIRITMKEIPEKLYKYIPAARINVLKNLSIRFTQPAALNDPFEFNLLFTETVSIHELRNYYAKIDKEQLAKEALDKLTKEQKALLEKLPEKQRIKIIEGFTAILNSSSHLDEVYRNYIAPETDNFKKAIRDTFNRSIGILSLSANPVSAPMWATYAENSTGLVLEYDTSHPFFNNRRTEKDEFYHLRKVIYEDRLPGGTLLEMGDDVFIHKGKSWEYENEWRMLLPLEKADSRFTTPDGDDISLFNFPASSISRIIFGLNTGDQIIKEILDLISSNTLYSHIELGKIKKGSVCFEIDPFEHN